MTTRVATCRCGQLRITCTGDPVRVSVCHLRATFRFCATCGATLAYVHEGMAGVTAVAVGAFADPDFPPPDYSVHERRKHRWVDVVGTGIEHYD